MSASINKVMVMGHVGRDPEMGTTSNGTPRAKLSVATNHRYTTQSGERKEEVEWHQVVVWGDQAKLVEKYVRKGSHVMIEGRLKTRSGEGDNGKRWYRTEIHCKLILFLNRMVDSEQTGETPKRERTKSQQMLELEGAEADDDFHLEEMA